MTGYPRDYLPITSRLKNMVNPLDCSSSWALTPVCRGRMGLGVGGAGVLGLTAGAVDWIVSLVWLSVSLDLLQEDSRDIIFRATIQCYHC